MSPRESASQFEGAASEERPVICVARSTDARCQRRKAPPRSKAAARHWVSAKYERPPHIPPTRPEE